MNSYKVTWEIEVKGTCPEDAADAAMERMDEASMTVEKLPDSEAEAS